MMINLKNTNWNLFSHFSVDTYSYNLSTEDNYVTPGELNMPETYWPNSLSPVRQQGSPKNMSNSDNQLTVNNGNITFCLKCVWVSE